MKAALHGIRDIGTENPTTQPKSRHLKTYIRPSHGGGRKTLKIIGGDRGKHEERKSHKLVGTKRGRREGSKLFGARPSGSVQRTFKCHLDSCGKIFNDRASLKKHMTVHGDKLYPCTHPGCDKRFLDNAKLKRHMLVHTGEKPY